MKKLKQRHRLLSVPGLLVVLSMLLGMLWLNTNSSQAAGPGMTILPNSAAQWIKGARLVGRHKNSDRMTIALMLHTQNQAAQQQLLSDLYNPQSPRYHQWLATGEFNARFTPSAADTEQVRQFLAQAGLHLVASPNPTLLFASGTISQVEAAFHTTISDYRLSTGKQYYGNDANVQLPARLGASVLGVFGLSNFAAFAPHKRVAQGNKTGAPPPAYGGGPYGSGLTPSQFTSIYGMTPVYKQLHNRGEGTTLAVYELSGYNPADVQYYENYYHLPRVPLVNRLVNGGASDHAGAAEVALDIELQVATAPGARQILVYQSPNTEQGALAQYAQIANDNQADALSVSWAVPCEHAVSSQMTIAEHQIFTQMAAQGQSVFAASGDYGAYGCVPLGIQLPFPASLQVSDPANQPNVTAVGGTSFQGPDDVTTFDPGKNPYPKYPGATKELTWIDTPCNSSQCPGGGSGGGVSRIWPEGGYAFDSSGHPRPGIVKTKTNGYKNNYSQSGAYCGQAVGILCRQSPDVSLNADPGTGYSIYCTDPGDTLCAKGEFAKPGWLRLGGTSCAAPIWAGIAALADSYSNKRLGLFNYTVYPFDSAAGYKSQFHDITKFSNGYYPAGPNYDMATGIGTPNVYNLIKR